MLGKGRKRDPTGIWLILPCRCTFLLPRVGALRYDVVVRGRSEVELEQSYSKKIGNGCLTRKLALGLQLLL